MLAKDEFKKQLPESSIVHFFVKFLTLYKSYLQPPNELIAKNVNAVIDNRTIGEGAATILQEAFYAHNVPAIHFLLEHGADPNLNLFDEGSQTVVCGGIRSGMMYCKI